MGTQLLQWKGADIFWLINFTCLLVYLIWIITRIYHSKKADFTFDFTTTNGQGKRCKLLSFYPRINKVLIITDNIFFYINRNLTDVLILYLCATADCGRHWITRLRVGKVGCHSTFAYGKSGHVSPFENSKNDAQK